MAAASTSSSSDSRQWELQAAPSDGITSVAFSRAAVSSDALLVSSWDGCVRCYRAKAGALLFSHTEVFAEDNTTPAAVLSACFAQHDEQLAFCGGLNHTVTQLQVLPTGETRSSTLGLHEKEVKEVRWNEATGTVVSAGWDHKLRSWDPRMKSHLASTCDLPAKAFTMDISARNVVVGCSKRKVAIFDVRKLDQVVQVSSSTLKHQTRVLRCMPDAAGYALGTVEGRIAIEYIDMEEHNRRTYSFKCHRIKDKVKKTEDVYPVNAIAFHPVHGTFATGGCDGHVYTWDGNAKKRLAHFSRYPTSVASMDFSADGSLLAIASSYTFEKGELDEPEPERIFVRSVAEEEVCPRRGKKRKSKKN